MCDLYARESGLPVDGTQFVDCAGTTIPGCGMSVQSASWRNRDIRLWRGSSPRTATGNGAGRKAIPPDVSILEGMDREIEIQGTVAGDGQPFGTDVEAADEL